MISSVCNRPSCGRSGSCLDGGGGYVGSKLKIVGQPASPRPASLELALLGPPFHRRLDQRVHEVHSGAPVQKILASAENGSFNPCARPFDHNFCICLYIQFIGVYWTVPSALVARQDVFGRGARPAGLQPLQNTSPKLVICITFASKLRIG